MSEQESSNVGCGVISMWLVVGGICAAVGLPALIVLLCVSTVVGGICGIIQGFNFLTGENYHDND